MDSGDAVVDVGDVDREFADAAAAAAAAVVAVKKEERC